MPSTKYPPYRAPYQPNSDLNLPFDPNSDPDTLDPTELMRRQDVVTSNQRLQDALSDQSQAAQPGGIANNPFFQLGVPAALTALTAIAPRHMAIAGPLGMSGYRTIEDTSLLQGRVKQTQAADVAKQRGADFGNQRLKYVIQHDQSIDPNAQAALSLEVDSGNPKAAEDYAREQQKALQYKAGQDFMNNPPDLPVGSTAEVQVPGAKVTLGKPPKTVDKWGDYKAAHPEMTLDQQLKGFTAASSVGDVNQQTWLDANPGKSPMDYLAARSVAEGAGGRAKEAADDANLQKNVGSYLDMVDQGLMPVTSLVRSPKMMGMVANANATRPQPVNLNQRLFEQNAIQAKLQNMQGEGTGKMIAAATSMNATLNNLEQAYNKAQHLLPTDAAPINLASLQVLAKATGNPDAAALLSAYVDAKQRAKLFVDNGYASSSDIDKAANDMFNIGLPGPAFKAALGVTRRNARDIVTMATQTPVIGIDQDAPALGGVNLGVHAKPTQMPGMETAPPVTGKYKSQKEVEDAYSRGEIGKATAKAILKKNGWTTPSQ